MKSESPCSCDCAHQFLGCVTGTSKATYNQPRGSIRQVGSLCKARARRESQCEGCCHRITRTIGINNFDAVIQAMYGQVQGRLIYLKQTHAFSTPGNQDALCVAAIKQALPAFFKLSLRPDAHAQLEFCFRLIRSDPSDALKTENPAIRI